MRINETIAEDFDCSVETRKVHVRRVLRNEIILSVSDRATLIFFVVFLFCLCSSFHSLVVATNRAGQAAREDYADQLNQSYSYAHSPKNHCIILDLSF